MKKISKKDLLKLWEIYRKDISNYLKFEVEFYLTKKGLTYLSNNIDLQFMKFFASNTLKEQEKNLYAINLLYHFIEPDDEYELKLFNFITQIEMIMEKDWAKNEK